MVAKNPLISAVAGVVIGSGSTVVDADGGWVAGRPGIGSVFWTVNAPVAAGVAWAALGLLSGAVAAGRWSGRSKAG